MIPLAHSMNTRKVIQVTGGQRETSRMHIDSLINSTAVNTTKTWAEFQPCHHWGNNKMPD